MSNTATQKKFLFLGGAVATSRKRRFKKMNTEMLKEDLLNGEPLYVTQLNIDETIECAIRALLSLEAQPDCPLDKALEGFNIMNVVQLLRFDFELVVSGRKEYVDTIFEDFSNIINRHPVLVFYSLLWEIDNEVLEQIAKAIRISQAFDSAELELMLSLLVHKE